MRRTDRASLFNILVRRLNSLSIRRFGFVGVKLPKNELGAVFSLANVPAESLRLPIREPVLRAVTLQR